MTNRELINELKQQSQRVNALKAKQVYRLLADELLRQIPEATILRTKPADLLNPNIPDDPEQLANYCGSDLFYYHFTASLPDGRAVRVRADNSLERFRVFRYYWLNIDRPEGQPPQVYYRESHVTCDSMVCNRSNNSLKGVLAKLAAREPKPNGQPLTQAQLEEYLNDQYNH